MVIRGSVAERSKALVLGTSLNEAWVRIPPLPELLSILISVIIKVNNLESETPPPPPNSSDIQPFECSGVCSSECLKTTQS